MGRGFSRCGRFGREPIFDPRNVQKTFSKCVFSFSGTFVWHFFCAAGHLFDIFFAVLETFEIKFFYICFRMFEQIQPNSLGQPNQGSCFSHRFRNMSASLWRKVTRAMRLRLALHSVTTLVAHAYWRQVDSSYLTSNHDDNLWHYCTQTSTKGAGLQEYDLGFPQDPLLLVSVRIQKHWLWPRHPVPWSHASTWNLCTWERLYMVSSCSEVGPVLAKVDLPGDTKTNSPAARFIFSVRFCSASAWRNSCGSKSSKKQTVFKTHTLDFSSKCFKTRLRLPKSFRQTWQTDVANLDLANLLKKWVCVLFWCGHPRHAWNSNSYHKTDNWNSHGHPRGSRPRWAPTG